MSKKYITTFCSTLFLLTVFFFLAYQHQHKPRIFILHSYSASMPWVQSLNEGVRKVFGDKTYISLRYFYMDTRHHHDPDYLERVRKSLNLAIKAWKPDILIAFDNDAQNMAVEEFAACRNLKIILAGISDSKRWLEYENTPNVTGITEQIPVKAIREILSLLFRKQKRIYYLSDDSEAARMLDKDISSQNWGSYELVAHKRVKTFAEWQQAVYEAEDKADILLISIYHAITDVNKRIKAKDLVKWMNEHSKIPVVGIYESFIIDGGILAVAISSLEQGYTAAWLALNIIEKKLSIQDVPLLHGKTFSVFMDKQLLLRHFPQVHIPVIIDAFSKSHWSLEGLSTPEIDLSSIEKLKLKKA
ncbi:ABC transporter substrate-binding protein [Legionella jordanis]|uniref:ABC transporter substrate binding protein n=1 Tax=Legionella jordanis TaxID=456 RepID=A0A0W0VCZ9_9GAMM|nr:ABC transporter substrate binding protein [Legionella jordanis]KTD17987.1 ABC transporter substrate binding protein [Legionella jordanis]RMX02323.1 hypothetical protein EAW55_08675 [Legionella jordanis]RMX15797.1 hypothetical protein EAS68_11860 [Legionella jordanis]VEH13921.1 ABC-type uncharacterized transport system, periplasmic component [Legionella jordanis]